jgi:hypothetical protein
VLPQGNAVDCPERIDDEKTHIMTGGMIAWSRIA